ncbi:hypothetical protein V5799_024408 [Amblyomma americanum]|uniref:Uncharacterized protein n=1 Tax=Amblyomma americanum TaxID=6943 RepID=A0AAQ4ECN2_AMBAM
MQLSIWPDDVDDNALDDIYNEFPVQESRYIDYWLKAKEAMRSLLGKPEGRRLQQYLTAGSDPLAEYNYWDNTLSVSLTALRMPLFSPNATQAINYAGLGALFARALVQAFDLKTREHIPFRRAMECAHGAQGVTLSSADDRTPLMMKDTERALEERLACTDPAAELTSAAFFRSAWRSTSVPRGLEVSGVARPAAQVFFMAQCRMMCGNAKSPFCAHAIRRVDAFAKAFGCKEEPPTVADKDGRSASCLFFT